MNRTVEQLENLKYNFRHAPDSHSYNSESIREIVCDCLELHKTVEKCYSEIEDLQKTVAESYKISSGTSSSKINWLIEKGMIPIGIVLGDEKTGDRTIVDFGACVKVNREDFRKLLTPNDYELKFEKKSK